MTKKQFKAESKKLLDMMINSIYTNKEIFLRELISNASDAIDKLYYRSLTDKSVKVKKNSLEIWVKPDKTSRTITIIDNGCGMTKDELEENLGTIAKSGSELFKENNDFVYTETLNILNTTTVPTNIISNESNSINNQIENEVLVVALDKEEEVVKEKDSKYTKVHKTSNGEKYTVIGVLQIPKINIKYDILSSTSVALLKVSLNRYWGAQPNEVGNMCVVGHNYLDSRFFGKLHKLNENDVIKITDSSGKTLNYYVYDKYVIDPYDTSCTSQLTNGETEITLITCYNKGTQRLVVKARAEKN